MQVYHVMQSMHTSHGNNVVVLLAAVLNSWRLPRVTTGCQVAVGGNVSPCHVGRKGLHLSLIVLCSSAPLTSVWRLRVG